LVSDLDAIFDDPVFARALVGARVESLATGEVLYERDGDRHVMPASNMKLVTLAVAAERLGWDFRFETRLEAAGPIRDGVLDGDLVVVGGGDPSIGSADAQASPLFTSWLVALREAGIRRIDGRLIGDDNAFDDEGRGGGWSWDYLTAGYAAPSGALSYNENVAVIRTQPGDREGAPARVFVTPPGHGFDVISEVTTAAVGGRGAVSVARALGSRQLIARGRIPASTGEIVRTTTVDNPTLFFARSLADTLGAHGVTVRGGAWDIDEIEAPVAGGERRVVVRHQSPPLGALAGRLMKDSQNFYAETLLKTVGLAASGTGSESAGRRAVRETLISWGIPEDAVVVYDGSGLSRYDYVTADAIVAILRRMWESEVHRGPFVATLPVGGHDGTLSSRMRNTELARHVQAKTGTIANVRSLSGYLERPTGEKLVFSIIANHFTASSSDVDALVEKALVRLLN
jgi:D-alanyl-D-alanine carboxypeptidase/D-alanyl-D-alanine-endopeptidase (penicillin-binding protein 4)